MLFYLDNQSLGGCFYMIIPLKICQSTETLMTKSNFTKTTYDFTPSLNTLEHFSSFNLQTHED